MIMNHAYLNHRHSKMDNLYITKIYNLVLNKWLTEFLCNIFKDMFFQVIKFINFGYTCNHATCSHTFWEWMFDLFGQRRQPFLQPGLISRDSLNHLSRSPLSFPSPHAESVGAGHRQAPPIFKLRPPSRSYARHSLDYRVSQTAAGFIPPKQSSIFFVSIYILWWNLIILILTLVISCNIMNYLPITLTIIWMLLCEREHNSKNSSFPAVYVLWALAVQPVQYFDCYCLLPIN